MTAENYATCASCFLTTQFPGIAVDAQGRCNQCSSREIEQKVRAETSSSLEELIKVADALKRERKGTYDCIIGASGGLDSSYVIYIAKRILGLNPLVVSYDHGFSYPQARKNLESVCRALSVDLRTLRSPGKRDWKYVRSIVLAFRKANVYWGICSFCHYVLLSAVCRSALDENISVVLASSNWYERTLNIPRMHKVRFMARNLRSAGLASLAGVIGQLAASRYHLLRLKLEYYVPPLTNLFKHQPVSPLRTINLTQYVAWDIESMTEKLRRETGWTPPLDYPNLGMRFDCKIEDSFINHTFRAATGCTVHGIIASNLVQGGVHTKEALGPSVSHYNDVIPERMEEVLTYLGIK